MLSKKAQYAFRALAVMVEKSAAQFREHAGGELPSETRPISIRDIVETQPMSVKFLESIFLELRRAGVLDSKRARVGAISCVAILRTFRWRKSSGSSTAPSPNCPV